MAWVEKNLKDHHCSEKSFQPLDQAAQSHIQPGLECLQGWGIHNLSEHSVPVQILPFIGITEEESLSPPGTAGSNSLVCWCE